MKTVYIMRGLPGTGKTTKAKQIASETNATICSADNFFEKDGVYTFDKNKIHLAHRQCWDKFLRLLNSNTYEDIIIDNTNTTGKEFSPYVKEAKIKGYNVKFAYPDSPIVLDVGNYLAITREDVVIDEEHESELLDKIESVTHRSGNFTRIMPRETLKAMLRRFEVYED